jgi:hypothetical protein
LSAIDIGITGADVSTLLETSPIVSIVGFQRCGKSALAENLERDLRVDDRSVFMQNATSWVRTTMASETGVGACVDPEIVNAMEELQRTPNRNCWIIDDAEVMFAYATDRVLASVREGLREGRFSVVLIRNRFVLEGQGWFHEREATLFTDIPTLTMEPLPESSALAVATAMFQEGVARREQGRWLAKMSGGVPGLMTDLYRYTPIWPPQEPDSALLDYAERKHHELDLGRPLRRILIRSLAERVLPPSALLSEPARRELGVLLLSGMVSPNYMNARDPFNGEFWRLVARVESEPIANPFVDTALNLESMFRKAAVVDMVESQLGATQEADIALAFANSLYCNAHFPVLVRPLAQFLRERLGRYGLARVAKANGREAAGATSAQLIDLVLGMARS